MHVPPRVYGVPGMPLTQLEFLTLLFNQLMDDRRSWEAHWRDILEHIAPNRIELLAGEANDGKKRMARIGDCTASLALRDLEAWLVDMMCSPSRPWMALTTWNPRQAEEHDHQIWLDGVRGDMLAVLRQSNYYTSVGRTMGDEAAVGTGVMLMYDDDEDVVRCRVYPTGSYALGQDARGRVDTFVSETRMKLSQVATEFGVERLSLHSRVALARHGYNQPIDVCHAIYPNALHYVAGSRLKTQMRWAECYWEKNAPEDLTGKKLGILREGGFNEFPAIAARWDTSGMAPYGTMCPGMLALPDVRALQTGTRKGHNAVDKMVDPPVQIPASMGRAEVSLLPGKGNKVKTTEGGDAIRPIHEVKADIGALDKLLQGKRERIDRAFYGHLVRAFMASGRTQPLTAEETRALLGEKASLVGPVGERHNDDVFEPSIVRLYNIMLRRELIPPPPASLRKAPLQIQYISEVALLQRAAGLGSIERHVSFLIQTAQGLVQAGDAPILDGVNWDELRTLHGESTAIAPRIHYSPEVIARTRAARQQAAQQAAALQAAPGLARAAKDLNDTRPDPESALAAVAGAAGGP